MGRPGRREGLEIWGVGFSVYRPPFFGGRAGRKIPKEDILLGPAWRTGTITVTSALGQYSGPASYLTVHLRRRAGMEFADFTLCYTYTDRRPRSLSPYPPPPYLLRPCVSPRHAARPPTTVGAVK